jgi:hypothetical protein
MSEEILYLIKKNDDCKLLTLDGCQFTWLVEWLYFLKNIFENCTDITDINHKKCKDNLKMVDQYLKIYISKMLNLNRLIVFLECIISRERHPDTLCLCGCNDYDKSEILQVKNTLRITKQILRLCREVARDAKQLILTKEQRKCLHQELSNYLKLRQLVCREIPTPNNEQIVNVTQQIINGILTDVNWNL